MKLLIFIGLFAPLMALSDPAIAVFGGSFSCIKASQEAKDAWAKALKCRVDTYGIGGCGFEAGRGRTNDVSSQIF